MAKSKERAREDAARDALYLTCGFTEHLMSPAEATRYLHRFSTDAMFRFEVILLMATDHMDARLPPEESQTMTRRQRYREEDALVEEHDLAMEAFITSTPSAEQVRLREMTWRFLVKQYGYPPLDVLTWEVMPAEQTAPVSQ